MPRRQSAVNAQQQLDALFSALFNQDGNFHKPTKTKLLAFLKKTSLTDVDLNTILMVGPQQGNSYFYIIAKFFPDLLEKIFVKSTPDEIKKLDFNSKAVGEEKGKTPFLIITQSAATGQPKPLKITLDTFDTQDDAATLHYHATIESGAEAGLTPFWFICLAAQNGREFFLEKVLANSSKLDLIALMSAKSLTGTLQGKTPSDILNGMLLHTNIKLRISLQVAKILFTRLEELGNEIGSEAFRKTKIKLLDHLTNTTQLAEYAQEEGMLEAMALLAQFYASIGDLDNFKSTVSKISKTSPLYEDFHFIVANELMNNGLVYSEYYDETDRSQMSEEQKTKYVAKKRKEVLFTALEHALKIKDDRGPFLRKAIGFNYVYQGKKVPAVAVNDQIVGQAYDPFLDCYQGDYRTCLFGLKALRHRVKDEEKNKKALADKDQQIQILQDALASGRTASNKA
ncbi:MAG: hypothetical protein HYX61_06095 [Gammaproteobacteria bacterium]|jgi:hypothetical protein|nr:hypothetical protein [Gammaproteobacteria bacterium]